MKNNQGTHAKLAHLIVGHLEDWGATYREALAILLLATKKVEDDERLNEKVAKRAAALNDGQPLKAAL